MTRPNSLALERSSHGSSLEQSEEEEEEEETPSSLGEVPVAAMPPAPHDGMPTAALFKMITADDAYRIVRETCRSLTKCVEGLPLVAAHRHVLAEDIHAKDPVPAYRASVKDGYAVHSADGPGKYPVVYECHAGVDVSKLAPLQKNTIAYISTGGPLPEGADAVVQVEDTKTTGDVSDGNRVVQILKTSTPSEDVREVGSDMAVGECVIKAGTMIGAAEVAMLATVGVVEVPVYRKPRVAIMSTGDEVEEPMTETLPLGKVRDANRAMLLAAVSELGALPIDMGIARDTEANVEQAIEDAISQGADVLISTGGVSMGNRDFIKGILQRMGTVHFGKICMKPGKPCTFATIKRADEQSVVFFGLPGNPVSALTTFHLYVSPSIKILQGLPESQLRVGVYATTTSPIRMDASRVEYRRVLVEYISDPGETARGKLVAHDAQGAQASSRIMNYHGANALLVVPSQADRLGETVLPAGTVLPAVILEGKRILRHELGQN